MPQNEYMEVHRRRAGRRLDHEERTRKREAREAHKSSKAAQELRGLRAKLLQKKRHHEKIQMRKKIKAHEERDVKTAADREPTTPVPNYLLDRNNPTAAKQLSTALKNRRAEKAARWSVPIPRVKGISDEEMFRVVKTGRGKNAKNWKRMITKPTFVGSNFTRRAVKYERFIRPMGLRYKKAHVTSPSLGITAHLKMLSVKKNPNNPLYTNLGVLTKGTIIEVDVSELSIVTPSGKVAWGRYAQVTNSPENDGCVNAVLLE